MDITLPSGSWRQSTEGNREVWALPGHTETLPYICIFQRKPSNSGATYGYVVKTVRAHELADGSVVNQIVTTEFANKVGQDATNAAAAFAVHLGIMNDTDLDDAGLVTGKLPSGEVVA